ncbi:MAG: hypothetical protein ABSF35_14165 [Polyangia bacterium]|jgi:hypothetical protein
MSAKHRPPKPPADGTDTKPSLSIVDTKGHEDDGEPPDGLDTREALFVEGVAAGKTLDEVCKPLGICARTGRRWRSRPQVDEAIRARLLENVSVGRAILSSGFARASRALVDMSDGTEAAESARVSAARAVVENVTRLTDLAEIERQIAELKAALAEPSTFTTRKGF